MTNREWRFLLDRIIRNSQTCRKIHLAFLLLLSTIILSDFGSFDQISLRIISIFAFDLPKHWANFIQIHFFRVLSRLFAENLRNNLGILFKFRLSFRLKTILHWDFERAFVNLVTDYANIISRAACNSLFLFCLLCWFKLFSFANIWAWAMLYRLVL